MGLFDQFKKGLQKTAQGLWGGLSDLFQGGGALSDKDLGRLEEGLLLADVGLKTAQALTAEIKQKARQSAEPQDGAALLREALYQRLLKVQLPLNLPQPAVILLLGVNGAGKTTTAGKLALHFSRQGRRVLLAAGDTFRAAAEEQLTQWAERAKVELFRGNHGAAPSAVVFDAVQAGLSRGSDLVLVDTAGRLHNRSNLMEELEKIVRVAQKASPGILQEKWLVLDANTGQNALVQAREFHQHTGLTGLVVTKLDGTAKGGVVVALAEQLRVPVRFIGLGEGPEDLLAFDARMFVEALIPAPRG
ncbi:MAG TPA: signal recognition particle-docking protein FtsY [bacterium]|nr:signal recognition particle-docking protein FtsY [bacterium]